jgi:CRP-like cAMP-binding protein
VTPCTVLSLSRPAFEELAAQSGQLREHLDGLRNRPERAAGRSRRGRDRDGGGSCGGAGAAGDVRRLRVVSAGV